MKKAEHDGEQRTFRSLLDLDMQVLMQVLSSFGVRSHVRLLSAVNFAAVQRVCCLHRYANDVLTLHTCSYDLESAYYSRRHHHLSSQWEV